MSNSLPTRVYKFNGDEWIEIDKRLSDNYTYNDAYIKHLVDKIGSGEFDPSLLSDSEQEQVENYLQQLK